VGSRLTFGARILQVRPHPLRLLQCTVCARMGKCASKGGCAVPESTGPVLLGQKAHQQGPASKGASATPGLVGLPLYSMPGFQPSTDRDPALPATVEVTVLSSSPPGEFGAKGTVVFLHGAGGSAQDYNDLWVRGGIDVPSGYTITFVQSPRGAYEKLTTPWLQSSSVWADHPKTLEMQADDDVRILKSVLHELQKEAGGYSKLWLCGRSQGACLATLLAVAGVGPTVAGAFSIAATALPQLQDIPAGEIYSVPTEKKLSALRLGFYSGEEDLQFTHKRPGDEGGTFPLLKQTLTSFSGVNFWLKQGAGHNNIGPSNQYGGDAFKVLFAFVQEQDPAAAGVPGVAAW